MARVRTDADAVQLRPGWAMLGFAFFVYGLPPLVLGLIGVTSVLHGGSAYLAAGAGLLVVASIAGAYVWHLHFWDEAVEATPSELRLRRNGEVVGGIDRDRLGATAFIVASYGSTGRHCLKVYGHDGEELDRWSLRFGYDDRQTRPFREASGVPDASLLRALYKRSH